MESTLTLKPVKVPVTNDSLLHVVERQSSGKAFIQANTIESSLSDIRSNHIIPVFVKDNNTLISQAEFIELTGNIAAEVFQGEQILSPAIRLSHPIKGRVPEAKHKAVHELLEH